MRRLDCTLIAALFAVGGCGSARITDIERFPTVLYESDIDHLKINRSILSMASNMRANFITKK